MPAIPEIISTEAYSPAALPMQAPDALTRANDIFTAGMRDVAGHLAETSARLATAQNVADAAGFEAKNAMALTDMRDRYAQDPDPATAGDRFRAEATAWQADQLDAIADPNTRFYVAKNLSHRIPVAYAEVAGQALSRQHAAQIGTLQDAAGTQAQQLAAAGNEADTGLAMQGLKAAIGGGVAAGTIDQHTGNTLFSHSIRQAATIRSASDPIGAQALIDRYAPEMQAGDVAEMTAHLRPQIQTAQENGAAAASLQGGSATAAGAQAIRAGFVARGYDDDSATALAANAVKESSAGLHQVNDDGTSRGIFQLTGERLATFRAQHGGLNPEQTSTDTQLDFADQELKTTEAPAAADIAAAKGVNAKAQAVSRSFLRPGLTDDAKAAEATTRGAIADRLATFGGQPSLPDMVADVQQRTANLSWQVQQGATAKVIEAYHRQQALLAPARAELQHQVGDLLAGYEAGITDPPIPDSQIRTLMPPADAQRTIEQLEIARGGGKLFSAVALASPADEQAARTALAVPGALTRPQRQGKQVGPAPAGTPGDGLPVPPDPNAPEAPPKGDQAAAPEDPANARLRLQIAAKYDELVARKHSALAADSAGYATQASPTLLSLAKSVDPQDPQTLRRYIDASLQAQAQLGVSQPRTLTNGMVAATVQALNKGDPAKTDIGAEIDGMRAQYGDHWPGAWHDLVTVGKLSPDWQVVAAMTEPAQAGARSDLIRALQVTAEPGGRERLAAAIPKADKATIDKNLPQDMEGFRASAAVPGEPTNLDLISGVQESIRTLAYSNALKGQSGEDALRSAVDSVLNQKWDFSGTLRAPHGMIAQAEALTSKAQSAITAADIQPPAMGDPNLTDAQNAEVVATAARRNGTWMANPRDDGAVLFAPLRNGARVPVIGRNGQPISVSWADLPNIRPPMPLPAPTDPAMGMLIQ